MDIIAPLENNISQLHDWASTNLFTLGSVIEIILIIIALGVGLLVRRVSRPHLIKFIDATSLPWHVKRVSKNLTKLLFYFTALILLGIFIQIGSAEALNFSPKLMPGVSKLLLAWIFIRIAAQFIENGFVRNVIATAVWLIAAFSILGILSDTMQALDALGFQIGGFRLSILSIIKSILGVFLFVYGAIFLSNLIERRIYNSTDLSASARVLLIKIIKFTLISVAILIGLTSAGIDLSMLAVFGGALAVGIGFGLQKGVSNLFSGMLLLLDRSIKPGDILELQNGTFGWVENMNARFTNIVTRDNKSFLIPNEDLITQRVVNWSHGDTLVRLEIEFGVHYESDPHLVRKIAAEAAAIPDRVSKEQAPVCHLVAFGDSALNFKLRFWITDAQEGVTNIRGQVFLALWDTLNENNIKIPYPHREVYIHETPK